MRRQILDYYHPAQGERLARLATWISCASVSLTGFVVILLFGIIGSAVHGDIYFAAAWGMTAVVFSAVGTITALWGVVFGTKHPRLALLGLLLNGAVLIWILRSIVTDFVNEL
jgi:hypothetical protein